MDYLFLVLLIFSLASLVVGLVRPQWVRMPSRKSAGLGFFGLAVIFFTLFAVTSGPSAPPAGTNATTAQSATGSTTLATGANSASPAQTPATSSAPLTAAQTLQADDGLFILSFNDDIVPDFNGTGSELQAFGSDIENRDYSTAIVDGQSAQADLQKAQTDLQTDFQLYQPVTPDVARIHTLTATAIASGLTGVTTAINDLENANNAGVTDIALPEIATAVNDYTEAKELVAGWQAKQQ